MNPGKKSLFFPVKQWFAVNKVMKKKEKGLYTKGLLHENYTNRALNIYAHGLIHRGKKCSKNGGLIG